MSFSDDVDDEVGGAIKSVVLRPDEPYFIKKTPGKISSPLDFEPDVTSANILKGVIAVLYNSSRSRKLRSPSSEGPQ